MTYKAFNVIFKFYKFYFIKKNKDSISEFAVKIKKFNSRSSKCNQTNWGYC